jgi:acetyltransferase-like isoleucine patch superfamily enzyme
MTRRGYLISLFPLLHLTCMAATFLFLCQHFSLTALFMLIFSIYLLPILCMHIHNWFAPLKEGATNLTELRYSPWWGVHQFQAIFNSIPAFEAILRLIPGAYSSWLRLWGSTIGKKIHWTPLVEIIDRSLLEVGDHVIFGHKVACVSHVILHKPDQLLLYVKRVTIGNHVFVGAGSRFAPGARVDDHMVLDYLTVVKINQHLKKESLCPVGE